jgi:hypothetical protein
MKKQSKNLKLAEALAAEAVAILRENRAARVPASHDIKMRICWTTEEYLRNAKSVLSGLQQAVERLEATTNFHDVRSAVTWVVGLDDLQRRRAEIEALTTALDVVEASEQHAAKRTAQAAAKGR